MNDVKILIISHERSGWHFAANSIAFNYGISNEQINFPLTVDRKTLRSFLELDLTYLPFGRIYKSHHDYFALEPFWRLLRRKFTIFYIIRDGRDVMTSCFYYFNKYSDRDFFKSGNVGTLIRRNPEGIKFHHCYWNRPVVCMADRWAKHISGYMESYDSLGIRPIWYEDLYENFEPALRRMDVGLIRETKEELRRPTLSDKCVFPRKGKPGDWVEHFREEDNDFFWGIAGNAMRLVGYNE